MSAPPFSVVIPAYNARRHLERAVMSVLKQTASNFELIVVENSSTDGTHEIVEAIEDPRINLLRKREKGLAAARNSGIQMARHDWIAFLDADDEWLPRHLENAQRILNEHTDLRWYCSAFERRRPDGTFLRLMADQDRTRPDGRIPDYFTANAKESVMSSSSSIIHKEIFNAVGGFNEEISQHGEDLDMWFRIALKYPSMGYSNAVGGYYYLHPDSITGSDIAPHADRVLRRIMLTIGAMTPDDNHRISMAKLAVSRWLDRWIRLCAKEGNRDLINEMSRIDRRLITSRVRILAMLTRWAPEFIIAALRKKQSRRHHSPAHAR